MKLKNHFNLFYDKIIGLTLKVVVQITKLINISLMLKYMCM